jgi:uncharacterized protein YhfF
MGELRAFTLGAPGELQDRLNDLVLRGRKTATAGLREYDYVDDDEAIDEVGEVQILLDGEHRALAEIEVERVEVHLFGLVPWEFAEAEGEGFRSIEHWRDAHREFYAKEGIEVADDDLVVCVWFKLLRVFQGS